MENQQIQTVFITLAETRNQMAAMLFSNGYTVRPIKKKTSAKGYAYGIEFWKEDITREKCPDE